MPEELEAWAERWRLALERAGEDFAERVTAELEAQLRLETGTRLKRGLLLGLRDLANFLAVLAVTVPVTLGKIEAPLALAAYFGTDALQGTLLRGLNLHRFGAELLEARKLATLAVLGEPFEEQRRWIDG